MPLEKRITFLTDYKKFSNDEIDRASFEKTYNLKGIYPSFFNHDDPLRKFLDAGATDILVNIENLEEYRRALDIVELKEDVFSTSF
jgi:hypothetical protein